MRTIDADKLIEKVKQYFLDQVDKKNYEIEITECNAELLKRIEECETTDGWIPADNPPKDNKYVLLSFANFSIPVVGRYEEDEEGGAYYADDEDISLVQQDMKVNAWMPLPAPYREEE